MPPSERLSVTRGSTRLAVERWPGPDPTVVLLHAGVTDRRSWYSVTGAVSGRASLIAYDRRGFGDTAPALEPFSHVEDLLAVLDDVASAPAWLVGSSAGGGVALDAAITAPERVAGLVLFAPAVSGAPEPDLDADTARFEPLIDGAIEAGDIAELNRLEAWLWLDGPAQPEGRVSGPARDLLLDMNLKVLRNAVPEAAGASDVRAWNQLDRVRARTTVACGDLDVPFVVERSRKLAELLPDAQHHVLPGTAHLPQLERPASVAQLIEQAIPAGARH
jgi:pimeloyl-ACP methyl ester carboxylesterase